LVILPILAACASPEEQKGDGERAGEASAPPQARPEGAAPSVVGAKAHEGAGASERDVAVLVVEEFSGGLRVLASNRVAAEDVGGARAWNGSGTPTHRWVLRGPAGDELASGPIAARRHVHLPPDPRAGASAAHGVADTASFIVRAAWPAAGEVIEIASLAPTAKTSDKSSTNGAPAALVRWQP
jgi:hypothetical protein